MPSTGPATSTNAALDPSGNEASTTTSAETLADPAPAPVGNEVVIPTEPPTTTAPTPVVEAPTGDSAAEVDSTTALLIGAGAPAGDPVPPATANEVEWPLCPICRDPIQMDSPGNAMAVHPPIISWQGCPEGKCLLHPDCLAFSLANGRPGCPMCNLVVANTGFQL